jgi:hypothetical protein
MTQEKQETSEVLMDAVVQKLEQQGQRIQAQEKKIGDIETAVKQTPNHSTDIQQVKAGIADLRTVLTRLVFPAEKIEAFSKDLTSALELLRQPMESKILHHHHVPKITWITGGLFILLCLACSGWYMTASRLDQYQGADTEYRYLYLEGNSMMRRILYQVDSLYRSGYAMRDSVVQWEDDLQRAGELKRQLQQKVGEGLELRDRLDELDQQDKARRREK